MSVRGAHAYLSRCKRPSEDPREEATLLVDSGDTQQPLSLSELKAALRARAIDVPPATFLSAEQRRVQLENVLNEALRHEKNLRDHVLARQQVESAADRHRASDVSARAEAAEAAARLAAEAAAAADAETSAAAAEQAEASAAAAAAARRAAEAQAALEAVERRCSREPLLNHALPLGARIHHSAAGTARASCYGYDALAAVRRAVASNPPVFSYPQACSHIARSSPDE